ncbi:hypothetical protein L1049_020256 [Liquidambar formosana]|uniref:Uncharacterized protein n=1 Tax=Liquidambar formosana TaxID=63359 RepID=A0AAP0SCH5_LIQFO
MGSLEEERLFQMVHDFIESESPPPIFSASSQCIPLNHGTNYFTLQEILKRQTPAEIEVLESVLKHMKNKRDAERTISLKKWLVMRLKMEGFNASLCHTSWPTTSGCPAGEYECIDVEMKDKDGGSVRLIVDIDFKSQFELARPTPTYTQLSETLPSIFVGNEDKLRKIISLLCSAAKQSLRDRGLHIPPWRTSTYMQSKWLCARHSKAPSGIAFNKEYEVGRDREAKAGGAPGFSKWVPPVPVVKPKRKHLGGGSGLSNQFSNMSINCC